MKADLFKSYRMQMFYYTLISAGLTAAIDVIFLFICAQIMEITRRAANRTQEAAESVRETLMNSMGNDNVNMVPPAPGYSLPDSGVEIFGQRFPWIMIIVIILLSAVMIIFIFCFLTRKMTRYIEEITTAIGRIAQGDFSGKVEVRYENEFSIIAQNLNVMALDLRLSKEKESIAESTKNELITNVAHDLRTPLTSIIGYLDILNSNRSLNEDECQKYLSIAYKKSKRLEQLINDLFSFTKLTYGNMPLKADLIDVVKLLEQQIDEFYPIFEENNLTCEFKSYETEAMVLGDGEMIARAFENLISNAVKYGKNGKVVKVIIKKEGEFIKVTVMNYGSVIPREDLPYIFDRFYRVEQSRQESTGGTGLGLSIAKSVIEKHDGHIEAHSSMAGTAFEVYLKLAARTNKTEVGVMP